MLPSFRIFLNPRLNLYSLRSIQVVAYSNPSTKGSTVDQKDVELHTKLLSEWWKPDGPMKALHSYNLIRVPFVRDGLADKENINTLTPLKNKKILDVGCGAGILSEPLARLGASVTGLDASSEIIESARQHSMSNPKLQNNMPQYISSSVEEHAAEYEECYDGVVASEIIEHVNNKELFVKSCVKTLKPGGRIFFTTPTRSSISNFTNICLAEYVFQILPKGTHQIDKFMTPTELTFLLERSNCHVEIISGMFYNVLSNNWHWIRNHSLFFALQAVKCTESNKV